MAQQLQQQQQQQQDLLCPACIGSASSSTSCPACSGRQSESATIVDWRAFGVDSADCRSLSSEWNQALLHATWSMAPPDPAAVASDNAAADPLASYSNMNDAYLTAMLDLEFDVMDIDDDDGY